MRSDFIWKRSLRMQNGVEENKSRVLDILKAVALRTVSFAAGFQA